MYVFIDENTIYSYQGEILKRYVGNKLVKTIANPKDEDLKEFGYMELVETEKPTYDVETQYIVEKYKVENGKIIKEYEVLNIPVEEIEEQESVGDIE